MTSFSQTKDPGLAAGVDLEKEQQFKYRTYYKASNLDFTKLPSDDYFRKLVQIRIDLVREFCQSGRVLDLCCGSGDYARSLNPSIGKMIGVDFSLELLQSAQNQNLNLNPRPEISYCVSNAAEIPLKNEAFQLVYSFCSLYYIPNVGRVVQECARLLRKGGVAILEFGNQYSLNTLVCRSYPELATSCHRSLPEIRRLIRQAGFSIERVRSFQILPFWGERPKWLRPLLHPYWKKLLARELCGRMLDEWVCALGPMRCLAFRHLLVCRKS